MAVATFSYAVWSALYPTLAATVNEATATALFNQAGVLYVDNSDCSVITNVDQRQALLYLTVAHLAVLGGAGGGSGQVGRLGSATEGSVSVRFEYKSSEASQWWDQTPYGAQVWAALAPFRLGAYVPAPSRPIEPYARGFRLGYSSWPL